jgi:hypothetical protein
MVGLALKEGVDMKKLKISSVIFVVIELLASQTGFSQGTVYISTLNQPSSGSLALGSDSWQANMFRTGNNELRQKFCYPGGGLKRAKRIRCARSGCYRGRNG